MSQADDNHQFACDPLGPLNCLVLSTKCSLSDPSFLASAATCIRHGQLNKTMAPHHLDPYRFQWNAIVCQFKLKAGAIRWCTVYRSWSRTRVIGRHSSCERVTASSGEGVENSPSSNIWMWRCVGYIKWYISYIVVVKREAQGFGVLLHISRGLLCIIRAVSVHPLWLM
jgi:hypothetical protein